MAPLILKFRSFHYHAVPHKRSLCFRGVIYWRLGNEMVEERTGMRNLGKEGELVNNHIFFEVRGYM